MAHCRITTEKSPDTFTERAGRTGFHALLHDAGLVLLSVLLFTLSFPHILSQNGWSVFGFFALVPVAVLVYRSNWISVWIYGFITGLLSYAVFNYWLLIFHPLAIFIVPVIYATYYLVLFPCLKLAFTLFPENAYLVHIVIWLAYEYLRTKGFLGYAYGILGYTQHSFLPLLQLASLTGVWGVSAIVVFPSFFLGNALKDLSFTSARYFIAKRKMHVYVYLGLLCILIIGGLSATRDYSGTETKRVSLVQHNIDPWGSNIAYYRNGLNSLIAHSNKALEDEPDIVVWSETAFVPRIDFHLKYRTNREYYQLVRDLLDYLSGQDVPFVIGNDHGEGLVDLGYGAYDAEYDYNAAMLYIGGERKNLYKKIHLVPFTENFPYEDILPWAYRMLREADTHFWEKGSVYTVFDTGDMKFSTPICFEDTFGYLSRNFVNEGAELIINMTNDSWSGSVSAMQQHKAMAVFRAVENRRSLVRAATGGLTCVIDPDGRVLASLTPFTAGHLTYDVPISTDKTTMYSRFGDYLAVIMLWLAAGLLLFGFVRKVILHRNRHF